MKEYKDKLVTYTHMEKEYNIEYISGTFLKRGELKVNYKKKYTRDSFYVGEHYVVLSKEHGLLGFRFEPNINWVRYNKTSITDVTMNMFSLYHRGCNWSNSRVRFSLYQYRHLQLNLGMMYCSRDYKIFMNTHGLNLDMSTAFKHYIPPNTRAIRISWAEIKLNAMYYFYMETIKFKYRQMNTRLYSARQNRHLCNENEYINNSIWTDDYAYIAKTFRQIDITDYKQLTKHNVILNDDTWGHIKRFMGLVNHRFNMDKRVMGMKTYQLINLCMYVYVFEYWDVHYFLVRSNEELIELCDRRATESNLDLVTRNELIMKALEF
jgi:hypothetical protein